MNIAQNIRTAAAGGGLLLAAGSFVGGIFAGEQAEPVDRIGIAGTGPDQVTALDICERPETEVFLVTGIGGGQRYEAKYETPEVRYDMTWQPDGAVVAVEELRGAAFEVRPEQIGPDFQACIDGKNVIPIEEGE